MIQIYSAKHPNWNRKLILSPDGTFVCGRRMAGTWRFKRNNLQLIWYHRKPQTLAKTEDGFANDTLALSPFFINKIFGVGLHRTGTRSLCAALNFLHFPTDHYRLGREFFQKIMCQEYSLPGEENCIGYTDLPIPLVFKELDQQYPGSKFILTVRSPDSWLASVNKHLHRLSEKRRMPRDREIHHHCYGLDIDDVGEKQDEVRLERYLRHNEEVVEYFKHRPDDLLVIDIMQGEGWEKLCPFLDESIPKRRFPSVGRRRPDTDDPIRHDPDQEK